MYIPPAWVNVSAEERSPDGRILPVSVWGWGSDEPSAKKGAADRLQRVLERVREGASFPDPYGYGNRPLREEILETYQGAAPNEPSAILTRNRYGARILNAARVLFLDIDFPAPRLAQRLLRLFGGVSPELAILTTLRESLRRYGRATFRVYRTAAGLRALAIDREFDPTGRDAEELMQATGTDSAFSRLCRAQRSFRARLTPKPWRCNIALPPGQHPRLEGELQQRFKSWLGEYEKASTRFATCRYLETIGSGSPKGDARRLLELHDRATRCDESLPLA